MVGGSQTNVDPTLDPRSVYYLHPSNNTGLKFVPTPFDGEGYGDWKQGMILALTSKNKIGFVDGTLQKPATNPNFRAWIRCNRMIIGWFISNLGLHTTKSI